MDSSDEEYLRTLSDNDINAIQVSQQIINRYIDMELDTGSGVFVIPQSDFDNYFRGCKLNINVSEKHVWSLLLHSHFVA